MYGNEMRKKRFLTYAVLVRFLFQTPGRKNHKTKDSKVCETSRYRTKEADPSRAACADLQYPQGHAVSPQQYCLEKERGVVRKGVRSEVWTIGVEFG